MPTDTVLFTTDHHWKVEIRCWASALPLYRTLGTRVMVYRKEEITSIWGTTVPYWVEEPASMIRIHNTYRGSRLGTVTREHEWRDTSEAELKEWSARKAIHLAADQTATQGAVGLDVDTVDAQVTVGVGKETVNGFVSATSGSREQGVPAAA